MKLFALFALLVCAVLALASSSPAGTEFRSAQLALPEPAAPREPRSASYKKSKGYKG